MPGPGLQTGHDRRSSAPPIANDSPDDNLDDSCTLNIGHDWPKTVRSLPCHAFRLALAVWGARVRVSLAPPETPHGMGVGGRLRHGVVILDLWAFIASSANTERRTPGQPARRKISLIGMSSGSSIRPGGQGAVTQATRTEHMAAVASRSARSRKAGHENRRNWRNRPDWVKVGGP